MSLEAFGLNSVASSQAELTFASVGFLQAEQLQSWARRVVVQRGVGTVALCGSYTTRKIFGFRISS